MSLEITEHGFVTRRLACSYRHLATPRFINCGRWESYAKYLSLFIGPLYTPVVRQPPGSLETAVSRKARL